MRGPEFGIAVIGAGIAGLSLAAELAELTDGRVVVLEQEDHPGFHASGRSAAILVEGYGTTLVRRLTALSLPSFNPAVLSRRGLLYIAIAGAPLTAIIEEGGAVSRVSPAVAVALAPMLRSQAIEHAFHDPTAADIDVHALQSDYLRRLRARGGKLITGAAVTGALWTGDRWRLQAGGEAVEAGIVVNAAGPWARQVASLFAAQSIGLTPLRRSAALVTLDDAPEFDDSPMVVDLGETIYFKPLSGKLMISPADETLSPPCDAHPEELDVAIAVERFEQLSRFAVRRVTHRWAGLRTFAPDRNPVVGYDAVAPSFFWVAGQGGVGVQTAPIVAQLAADLLLRRAPRNRKAGELAPQIAPARFMVAAGGT
jgi:D-arginine dehydrogenase